MLLNQHYYLIRRTLDVKERITSFEERRHTHSSGAHKLSKWGIRYCNAIISGLSDNVHIQRRILKDSERIHRGLDELGSILRYFESTIDIDTPNVFINHFEELIKKIHPQDSLVIRPNNIYNYKAKSLLSRLTAIYNELPPVLPKPPLPKGEIFVIGYPKYEKNNDLINCLMAHEIGHYIYYHNFGKYDLRKMLIGWIRKQPDYQETINKLVHDGKEKERLGYYRIEMLVENWFKESFCDWFAFKFMGPSFYFALVEQFHGLPNYYPSISLKNFPDNDEMAYIQPKFEDRFFIYPSPIIRGNLIWNHYKKIMFTKNDVNNYNLPFDRYERLNKFLSELYSDDDAILNRIEEEEYKTAIRWVKNLFLSPMVLEIEERLVTNNLFYCYKNVLTLWELLINNITPNAIETRKGQLPADWRSILYAGWLHLLTNNEFIAENTNGDLFQIYHNLFDLWEQYRELIRESLEMAFIHKKYLENKISLSPAFVTNDSSKESHAKHFVKRLLYDGVDLKEKVFITPLFDHSQIREGSIDIRLGYDFILFNRSTGVLKINPIEIEEIEKNLNKYQTRIKLQFGESLFLHPGELILARTLEYVSFPVKIAGEIIGRSSWGRLGPIIATAPRIQPGFKGTVTLEIINLGNVPVVLYPCLRIGQLVLYKVDT